MTCTISHTTATMGLTSFAIFQALTAKCPLVNTSILQSAEWHSIILQLQRNLKKNLFNHWLENWHGIIQLKIKPMINLFIKTFCLHMAIKSAILKIIRLLQKFSALVFAKS